MTTVARPQGPRGCSDTKRTARDLPMFPLISVCEQKSDLLAADASKNEGRIRFRDFPSFTAKLLDHPYWIHEAIVMDTVLSQVKCWLCKIGTTYSTTKSKRIEMGISCGVPRLSFTFHCYWKSHHPRKSVPFSVQLAARHKTSCCCWCSCADKTSKQIE